MGLRSGLFYGFDDLDGVSATPSRHSRGPAGAAVTVSLTYEAGRDALAARAETVEELRPIAAEVESSSAQTTTTPMGLARRCITSSATCSRSGPALGATRAGRSARGPAVPLLEAGGERAEAELVAAEVLALPRAGVPGEEIVVLYRSPAAAPLLSACSSNTGSAWPAAGSWRSAHTTLGRVAAGRGPLRAARRPGAGRGLLAYLRAPGLLAGPEAADALDALDARRG